MLWCLAVAGAAVGAALLPLEETLRRLEMRILDRVSIRLPVAVLVEMHLVVLVVLLCLTLLDEGLRGLEVRDLDRVRIRLSVPVLVQVPLVVTVVLRFTLLDE